MSIVPLSVFEYPLSVQLEKEADASVNVIISATMCFIEHSVCPPGDGSQHLVKKIDKKIPETQNVNLESDFERIST